MVVPNNQPIKNQVIPVRFVSTIFVLKNFTGSWSVLFFVPDVTKNKETAVDK